MMMRKCVSSHHQCKPISGRLGPIYLLFNIGKPISGLDTSNAIGVASLKAIIAHRSERLIRICLKAIAYTK